MNNQYDKKVTYLDELPDLDDLEIDNTNFSNIIPSEVAEKYRKVIRSSHVPGEQSGMAPQYPQQQQQYHTQPQQQYQSQNIQRYTQPSYENYYQQSANKTPMLNEQYTPRLHTQTEMPMYRENFLNMSCLDFAGHVKGCPICSKFYNNDRMPYIITILFLVILCLILLNKVLHTKHM
jgi:hypothetical protein